jgi:hypothetical protein
MVLSIVGVLVNLNKILAYSQSLIAAIRMCVLSFFIFHLTVSFLSGLVLFEILNSGEYIFFRNIGLTKVQMIGYAYLINVLLILILFLVLLVVL